jgi:hypothetical protein
VFLAYLEQVLVPEVKRVKPEAVVVMDHLRSHTDSKSPFENGYGCAMRRSSKLPMATKIMASDTSQRSS